MKIQILKQTSIAGVPARVGDVVEVSEADGRFLLGVGKAIEAEAAPAPVVEPPTVEASAKRKPRTKVTTDGDLPADD
jgi:hypothetical protein